MAENSSSQQIYKKNDVRRLFGLFNRNPPRHRNSVNNLMPLGYVADVDAWMSGNFFFLHTLHEICVCSHMGTLGGSRDVFLN